MKICKLTLAGALMLSVTSISAEDVTPAQTAVQAKAVTAAHANNRAVLEIRALDKITGHAVVLYAPLNMPVKYETLTITARKCYSTPPSEPPETSAFLEIQDHRPAQAAKQVFSGWMYASSPGINGMEHPLYDVWVVKCRANAPDQALPQTEVTVSPQDEADTGADDDPNAGTPENATPPDTPETESNPQSDPAGDSDNH